MLFLQTFTRVITIKTISKEAERGFSWTEQACDDVNGGFGRLSELCDQMMTQTTKESR